MSERSSRFRQLQERYLREALQDAEELLQIFSSAELSEERRERAAKLSHDLRGSGGSYGFPLISDSAGEIETSLRELEAPDPRWPEMAESLLRIIQEVHEDRLGSQAKA